MGPTEAFELNISALRSVTVSIWTSTILFALDYGNGVMSGLGRFSGEVPRTSSPRLCAGVPVDLLVVCDELTTDVSGMDTNPFEFVPPRRSFSRAFNVANSEFKNTGGRAIERAEQKRGDQRCRGHEGGGGERLRLGRRK